MTRVRAAELGFIGAATAYIAAAARLPPRARIATNLAFAGGILIAARAAGADTTELGIARRNAANGVRTGVLASLPVAGAAAAIVAVPAVRALLAERRITATTPGEALFEVLVRIPLETATAEELVFRGALLGLGLRTRSATGAIVTSSLAFGLWHVPTTFAARRSDPTRIQSAPEQWMATAVVVAATTVGGIALATLRIRSRSVIATILAHAALNMTVYSVLRLTNASTDATLG